MRKQFLILAGISWAAILPTAPALAQNQICNLININCAKSDSGYSSFDECWADQGASHCPEYTPSTGDHDYSGGGDGVNCHPGHCPGGTGTRIPPQRGG